ncbi:MAG: hypothetical protein ABIQ93_14685 [Saprospiraceae bacterium]
MTWQKDLTTPNTYLFEDQGRPFGQMHFDTALVDAACVFQGRAFHIRKRGFWSGFPQIVLPDGTVALSARSENWYGSTQILHCGTGVFKGRWQNNALGEFIIFETDRQYPLLAVGLKIKDNQCFTQLTVSDAARKLPELALLLAYAWHSFLPASQQGMDDGGLTVLLASVA